jgi:hypothetical protein
VTPATRTPRRPRKRAKKLLAATVFAFLGRGIVAAAGHDARVRAEVLNWPDDTVIALFIAPDGPRLTIRKQEEALEYLGLHSQLTPTLMVQFKSVDVALPVLIGMKGVLQAFAEHRSTLAGDLGLGMSLMRCLHIVEGYLFPDIIGKRILPRAPTREASRFAVYVSTLTSTVADL